ncbi:hypothetical protein UlMin_015440 [Ulmus minor]
MGGPATGETNRARKNYARQSRTDPFPHQVNLTGHKEKIPRLSDDPIIFTEGEARGLWHFHTDAIVVTLCIAGRKVFRILVDNGSSADILFKSTFNRMNLVGVKIEPTTSAQVQGIKSSAKSRDETPTTNIPNENGSINNPETAKTAGVHGVNAIHLRDGVHCVNSIMIGIIEVKIDEVKKFDELDPREPVAKQHGEPVEELTEVPLFDDEPVKTCKIGSVLTGQFKEDLIIFLREHRDVFTWSHEDMPGIDPNVIVHHLNIDPNFKLIKQKRRTFNAERYMAINTEVDKLLKAGFIEEANYPDWIANVVLVKKANGNWRVCIDFTDLNRACPKDSFPLPRIDQLVDATTGHELLSFMDAYSGYNQIRMHEED